MNRQPSLFFLALLLASPQENDIFPFLTGEKKSGFK